MVSVLLLVTGCKDHRFFIVGDLTRLLIVPHPDCLYITVDPVVTDGWGL